MSWMALPGVNEYNVTVSNYSGAIAATFRSNYLGSAVNGIYSQVVVDGIGT